MAFLQQDSTKYFRMFPWLTHCRSKAFSNTRRAVKHLEPACGVMLFPPTNPFLILAVQTIPWLFLHRQVWTDSWDLALSVSGKLGARAALQGWKGHLLLHFAHRVPTLNFHFQLHLGLPWEHQISQHTEGTKLGQWCPIPANIKPGLNVQRV